MQLRSMCVIDRPISNRIILPKRKILEDIGNGEA